jgi:hypothetical protein
VEKNQKNQRKENQKKEKDQLEKEVLKKEDKLKQFKTIYRSYIYKYIIDICQNHLTIRLKIIYEKIARNHCLCEQFTEI